MTYNITVLGAGAWGTALAIHLAKRGHTVTLWAHRQRQAECLNQKRENTQYLPGITLPEAMHVTAELTDALDGAQAVLVVVPSQVFCEVLSQVKQANIANDVHIAWATKGFEPVTQRLLHQVAFAVMGEHAPLTVLSGPTFAQEVAQGLPTAMVSASTQAQQAAFWAQAFTSDAFRVYTQSDMIGVEVGGAYKNIMAIATGVSDGLRLGANARAALVSRGMVEMMRLSEALGGKSETIMGLAGLGDLVLTCTDDLSRNRRFGFGLAGYSGQGEGRVEAVINEIGQVVEGVKAVYTVKKLAEKYHLDLPIMEQVYSLVTEQETPKQAVKTLLARSVKPEND